jgi:hypothetical protein
MLIVTEKLAVSEDLKYLYIWLIGSWLIKIIQHMYERRIYCLEHNEPSNTAVLIPLTKIRIGKDTVLKNITMKFRIMFKSNKGAKA